MELGAAGLTALYATLDADVAAAVAGLELPSVRLEAAAGACEPDAAVTRFGGVPLVSGGFAWPRTEDGRPLCLVGQWDCDEVNGWLGEAVLPAGTLLSFFFDVLEQAGWGLIPQDAPLWRVVVAAATAVPARPPAGAFTFPARPAVGRRVATMPDVWEPVIRAVWADGSAAAWAYERLRLDDGPGPVHRMFGWPDPQQASMHLDCQLVANGVDLMHGGYDDPRVPDLQAGAADWRLLWQVGTDEEQLGWMWGDMGTLYFWIRAEDLAAGRFDRVWAVLQG
ncbi:YwqG family protein [Dactylosporangium sp. NBC_01737]|uniref:YwqG family protein n=1 Tax=Dactylosporangium sp. NBC_01737 TaxID=2975959 RepID=UPI002E0E435D|nr:YwqG family protein [Dactylosporangium sp. NBC_01737]